MEKLILIIIDGLSDKVASVNMGFMAQLVEGGLAVKGTISATTPTLSRPLYETILTGKSPLEHGIFNNMQNRQSHEYSIFHIIEAAGLVSAASAYSWISELYMKTPFNHKRDCYQLNGEGPIHYGIYYYEDSQPDAFVFDSAHFLMERYEPSFLLVHPMNVDNTGHLFGGASREYSLQVRKTDIILSDFLMDWLERDYKIIVTADHGMCADGAHSGIHEDERLVPFWVVHNKPRSSEPKLPETSTEILDFILSEMGLKDVRE